MKLILDDANISNIKKAYEYFPIKGVTTNPSILKKVGKNPFTVLKEIREFIGKNNELHVQVVSKDYEGMIEDAKRIIKELGDNTFVKVPAVTYGFKAMKTLHKEGINITATAIYTPMQAYISSEIGASYAAPYINRIDNMGYNGIEIAKDIQDIFTNNNMDTEVLAASFKNSQQVLELLKYGIGAATISTDVLFNLVNNKEIDYAIDNFIKDFEVITATGKTMKDC